VIEQAHAERMKDALERIVDGLYTEPGDPDMPVLTVDDVTRIARRALDPDEWERVHD